MKFKEQRTIFNEKLVLYRQQRTMLKWLAGPGVKEGSKGISITSDPLATIHNKRRSKHVYSVNR